LFIVLSLFTLYLFTIGYATTSRLTGRARAFDKAGLAIAAGILINFSLMLTGQPIVRVWIAGSLLAFWGVVKLFVDSRTRPASWPSLGVSPVAVCGLAYVLIVYYFGVFAEPLSRWDARSIWFFHAKMIWTEGALRQSAGWNDPSLAFSNPDYPKLVPSIAAQLGYLRGFWNEFLPKGSLFVMLVPLGLWVFSFFQKRLSFVLLVSMFFFGLGAWLWNGYMDGYVALYSGVSLLLFGRYASERRETDLYSGICALGIAANIKNEGLLFGLCLVAALMLVTLGQQRRISLYQGFLGAHPLLLRVLVIAVAPTLLWAWCKKSWGLQNDLAVDPSGGMVRLWNRLADGTTPGYLLNFLAVRANTIWVVAALSAAAATISVYRRMKIPPGTVIAALAAILYSCGLYAVYLSTPHDILPFYLVTSATRTMATASVSLFISAFFLLSAFESHDAD
jgi:hypothetical protein